MHSKKESLFKIVLFVSMLLVILQNVSGIGMSPAKATLNYVDPINEDISYTVRSNTNKPIIAGINISGDMSDFVTLSTNEIPLAPGASGKFNLNLNIPENHGLEGKHILWVKAYEKSIERESESSIMVTTAVNAAIVVYFPYEGKSLDILQAHIKNVNELENSEFSWEIISRGSENLYFMAILDVFDRENHTVMSKEYGQTLLLAGDSYKKKESLKTSSLKAGAYRYIFTAKYDGKEKFLKSSFNVGTEDVALTNYAPKNLTFGEINKMRFSVKSLWNDEFDNVYGAVKIGSVEASTPTVTLEAFKTVQLEQFIDISGLEPAVYNGTITVFFGDRNKEFPFSVNIVKPDEDVLEEETKQGLSLLSIMLFVLAVILFTLVIVLLRQKKHQYP